MSLIPWFVELDSLKKDVSCFTFLINMGRMEACPHFVGQKRV
jgi:hypothetical protein